MSERKLARNVWFCAAIWGVVSLVGGCSRAAERSSEGAGERPLEGAAEARVSSQARGNETDSNDQLREGRLREDAPQETQAKSLRSAAEAPGALPSSQGVAGKAAVWREKCGNPKPLADGFVEVTFRGTTSRLLYGGTLGTFSYGACCEACASLRNRKFTLRASKSEDLERESLYVDAEGVTFYDSEGRVWSGGKHRLGEREYGERLEGSVELPLRIRREGETSRLPAEGSEEILRLKFSLPKTP